MHTTLDGFADSRDGFVPIMDRAYWKELDAALAETGAARADTFLLGKGTYRQFEAFWPKAAADPKTPADWREQAQRIDATPKVVFSSTLPRADWRGTTIVRGDFRRAIRALQRRPGGNLLVPGGVAFPRALIAEDLVDEYLLSVVPLLLGQGRHRLFGPLRRPRKLTHVRSWTFSNGVVLQQYRRDR